MANAERAQRIAEHSRSLDPESRASYLHTACDGDTDLLARVEALIEEHPEATAAIEPEPEGRMIAHFSIRRTIGSGGMGVVYEAMQSTPRRKVALKVMRQGIESPQALRRFEFEAQILARLVHPGIAQIYEAGRWDDGGGSVPWFAMEYVIGAKPLTDFAEDKQLDRDARLRLFCAVCEAVGFGHARGVIHRDLKPANLLVDGNGVVKVIDFGVARSTDSDLAATNLQTNVGQLLGTVQYMSPEQCEADPDLVDTRSDIYSLGVVLYELLYEDSPYDLSDTSVFEAIRIIREEPPIRVAAHTDIETIVFKALEKERDRRYQTVSEFQVDIQRCLAGEPIAARAPSLVYQLQTFSKRYRRTIAWMGAVGALLVIGVCVSTVLAVRASRAEARAEEALMETERQLAIASAGQAFARDLIRVSSPFEMQGERLTLDDVLVLAADSIDKHFEAFPIEGAKLRGRVGVTLHERDRLMNEAGKQLFLAHSTLADELGLGSVFTLNTTLELALYLFNVGRFEECLAILEAGIEAAPQDDDAADRQVALAAMHASMLGQLGRPEDGVPRLKAIVEGWRSDPKVADWMRLEGEGLLARLELQLAFMGLGEDFGETLSHELAERLDALSAESHELLGARHPVTIRLEVARLLPHWRNPPDSAEVDAVLAAAREVFGPTHRWTLESLVLLGEMLYGHNLPADSSVLLREALAGFGPSRDGTNPHALRAAGLQAENLQLLGLEDVEWTALARRASTGMAEFLPEVHPYRLHADRVHAIGLFKQGELEEGVALFESVLTRLQRVEGSDSPNLFIQGVQGAVFASEVGRAAALEMFVVQGLETAQRRTMLSNQSTLELRLAQAALVGDDPVVALRWIERWVTRTDASAEFLADTVREQFLYDGGESLAEKWNDVLNSRP